MLYAMEVCDYLQDVIERSGVSGLHSTEAVWVPVKSVSKGELNNRVCSVFPGECQEERFEKNSKKVEFTVFIAVQQVAKNRATQDEVAGTCQAVKQVVENAQPFNGFKLQVGDLRHESSHLKDYGVMTVYFELSLQGYVKDAT